MVYHSEKTAGLQAPACIFIVQLMSHTRSDQEVRPGSDILVMPYTKFYFLKVNVRVCK
jgi:hypothetical protein